MRRSRSIGLAFLVVIAMFLSSCGKATTEPVVEPTQEKPTQVNFALIFATEVEQPWCMALIDALDKLNEEKPHGLSVNYDYSESVSAADAERILREYAESNKYQVIWAHSAYADQIKTVYQEYPEILWAYTGGGNYALGDNAYWVTTYLYEPSYLIGMLSGMLTETDIIGAVTSFQNERVNAELNAWVAGAKEVNPDVEVKISYVETFYDPPKVKDAAYAQIAAGVDNLYAQLLGCFEACREKDIFCYGAYGDQYEMAPDVIVTSAVLSWKGAARYLIDTYWDHEISGASYDAPMEAIYFGMAEGGSDLAPLREFEEKLPQEVVNKVMGAKQDILDGTLEVPLVFEPVETD